MAEAPPLKKPLYVTRLDITGRDYGLLFLFGVPLILVAVFLPIWLQKLGVFTFPPNWGAVTFTAVFSLLGLWLAVWVVFRRKAILKVMATELRVVYPFRVPPKRRTYPYVQVEHLRFGETKHHYWLRVFLTPQTGQPNEEEIEFETFEADVLQLARELEGLSLDVVFFQDA